jgi:hypothetical protein
MCGGVAAHLARRLQAATEGWALGVAEDAAAQVGIKLDAGDAGGLAGCYLKAGRKAV